MHYFCPSRKKLNSELEKMVEYMRNTPNWFLVDRKWWVEYPPLPVDKVNNPYLTARYRLSRETLLKRRKAIGMPGVWGRNSGTASVYSPIDVLTLDSIDELIGHGIHLRRIHEHLLDIGLIERSKTVSRIPLTIPGG